MKCPCVQQEPLAVRRDVTRTAERDYRPFSYPGFSDVRDAGGPFAHLAGHTVALAGVIENNTTRQATVDVVTTGFVDTLGVQPVYGRDFTMEEERPGTPARSVAVGGTTPVIIDVTLAEGLFANDNPVGRLLQYGADSGTADSKPMVIVAGFRAPGRLAPAVKHDLFKNRPEAHLYVPSGPPIPPACSSTRVRPHRRRVMRS